MIDIETIGKINEVCDPDDKYVLQVNICRPEIVDIPHIHLATLGLPVVEVPRVGPIDEEDIFILLENKGKVLQENIGKIYLEDITAEKK